MKRTDRHQGQLPVKVEVNGDAKASRRRSSEQSSSNEQHSGNGRAYEKKSEVERKSITTRSLTTNNQPVTSRLSTSNLRATHEIESSLPTIAVNGDEIDDIGSGFRPEEDDFTGDKGGNSALNATTTTSSSSYSLNTRMSRSGRNKVAAEMAYLTTMSAYPDGRPVTPTRRGRRASKDAPRLSTSRPSRIGGELGKMEATAASIVEDAIQKALEALHGKQTRRSETSQNITSSSFESNSLGVSGNASEIADMRRATQEMSSQRNKKSVSYSNSTLQADEQLQRNSLVRSLRDEQQRDSIAERQNRSSLSKQRQLSSESTMTTSNVHRQRNFYDIGDASGGYYGSSEWYGSDLYLSPVQTYQRNSVSSSGRRVSGYASDTALWSPPIQTSNKPPQLSTAAASDWRSGSTDSDFSTTLEIKKKKRVNAVSNWNAVGNVSSLDRGLQRRPNRAPTLTKGMVTKILHGAIESDDVAVTSSSSAVQSHQNQARSRSADLFGSKQKTFDPPVHVATTPTGFNVSSVPTAYNANTFQQSSAAGGKQLIVDVVDQRNSSRMRSASTEPFMTSSPLTVGEGTSWTTTARSMTASPTYRRYGGVRPDFDAARYQTAVYSSDDEATTPSAAGLRLQQATDRRIDLVFDPGQLYRQQSKVRVFGEHSSGGIRSPSGLPSIAESDLERRHHQQLTSNSYAAFSNEPIIVADLMNSSGRVESANDNRLQQQNGFHQMRRSQSADDLDGIRSGSGTPIFSTTARPDINMVKSQVLNLYLFNRGDQPTGPDQRRPGRQDETVTRTMEFDDEVRRTSRQTQTSIRRKEVVQVPVVVESPPQIQREITHYVTTERERAPLPTVERKLTSNAAVQVETETVEEIPIAREDSPIPLAFQQFFEPPTPAPPQRRKIVPVLPANVTQETVIRKPTVVETRQIEMTGDVFESRVIPEPEVVRLREPEVETTNVVEDSVEEDEEEMLETEVIEEKEQRIEMTIREDIEFSLQRSQGSMKPIDGDADGGNKRVNIEPWWIPPKFEAIVDHKKQKITQVKDIENKDDYLKKVDKGNESVVENDDVNSRRSSYQPIVGRNHRPYNDEYSHQPIGVDKPFKVTSDITVDAASSANRPTLASATDFEVPVVVEDAYRSPVLTVEPRPAPFFSSSGGSSSRPYLYGKTDYGSEKLQQSYRGRDQSPVRRETVTDRSFSQENGSGTDSRQQLQNNNNNLSNSEPKSDKRHYVTSYTKYISAPSQSPLSSWNNRKYLAYVNADVSGSDAPVPESGQTKGSQVTTGKTFPRSIISLPSPPAISSAGGGGVSHEYYYDTSGGLSDADDRLPESLDHFDRMLSHLEREYLSASVLDDADYQTRSKQQTTGTAPAEHKQMHNDAFGSKNDAIQNLGRQVAAANLPNSDKPHQLPQSSNDRKGNGINHFKRPPPPPPLKSWKAGAENQDRNAPNNYTSQINTSNAPAASEYAASKLQRPPAVKTTAKLTLEPRPPIEGRVEKQTTNSSFYPPADTAAVTRPGSYGTGGRPQTKRANDVSYNSAAAQDEETDEHHFSRQLGDRGYMSLSLAANESDARSGRWTTDHGQVSADDDDDDERIRPTTATNSSPVFLSSGWKSLDRYRNVDRPVDGGSLLEQIAEQRQKLRGSIYKSDVGTTSGGGGGSKLDPSGYETAVTAL